MLQSFTMDQRKIVVGLGPTFAVGNKNYSDTIDVERSISINMIQLVFLFVYIYIYIYILYTVYTHQHMASQTSVIYIACM